MSQSSCLSAAPPLVAVSRKNADAKVKAKEAVKIVAAIGLILYVRRVLECDNLDLQTKSLSPTVD